MFAPNSISVLQVNAFLVTTAVFVTGISWIALRNVDRTAGNRRLRSLVGIALQSLGCAAAGIGLVRPVLPWWAPFSLVSTVLVLLLGGTAIAMFLSAATTMGKNWSLVARTRPDRPPVAPQQAGRPPPAPALRLQDGQAAWSAILR